MHYMCFKTYKNVKQKTYIKLKEKIYKKSLKNYKINSCRIQQLLQVKKEIFKLKKAMYAQLV